MTMQLFLRRGRSEIFSFPTYNHCLLSQRFRHRHLGKPSGKAGPTAVIISFTLSSLGIFQEYMGPDFFLEEGIDFEIFMLRRI
jgi:hypothetical protein